MKWSYKEPTPGDMVRVALGGIYHFGIYVSDTEVIQFGLPPTVRGGVKDSEVEVISTDVDVFLAGGFLEVCEFDKKERKKNRSPEKIIDCARSKIGQRGYNILYNNCEHFANECVSGEKICRQTEDLRAMFRSLPLADVYLAELPLDCDIGVLESRERMDEINSISNERVKREKYFVFKLLYYALERSFGLRGNKLELKKELYGGWSCGDIYLSLSHSDGALAVAVSRAPIGVDIERVKCPRKKDLARHILNEKELSEYESIPEENREKRLIELWTAKEAIFKSKGLDRFLPTHTDTLSESFVTKSIELKGEYYIFSVATATPERVRVYDKVKLSD